MITIGQLARYAGVSTKTIRVYHDKGLLAEPDRDTSGYRRYTAQHKGGPESGTSLCALSSCWCATYALTFSE